MADEYDEWLDRETSERLLSGEPPQAVAARAGHLVSALGVLAASAAPATTELPGEQAALAAFRAARGARDAQAGPVTGDGAFDAGVVRIGAPAAARRERRVPRLRLALAAALAVGTLGGVAAAAGTGVLPGPFRHDEPGRVPRSSVSADASAGRPLATPSPGPTRGPGPGSGAVVPRPGTSGTPGDGRSAGDEAAGKGTHDPAPSAGTPSGSSGSWLAAVAESCRDLRDGKEPPAGRRRALEGLAGGSARVNTYCRTLLTTRGTGVPGTLGGGLGTAVGGATGHGGAHGTARPTRRDREVRDQGGKHGRHRRGGLLPPVPSAFAPPAASPPARLPTASPDPAPTYRAL